MLHPIRYIAVALVLSSASLALARQAQPDPLPTMQELQELQDKKDWPALLTKISRVLNLKGNAAQNYDRYEVLMMKGEGHLQQKQLQPAIGAFTDAAKEPTAEGQRAAIASSTAQLVKRSQAFVYKRKAPTSQPSEVKEIDVLDPASRKDGFAALVADELAVLQPKAKAATSAKNLRPVVDMLKSLDVLRSAELAGTGATAQASALVGPLATHTRDLSAKAVAEQKGNVDVIEKAANQVVDVAGPKRGYGGQPGYRERRYKRRGLMYPETQSLKKAIDACSEISSGMKELAGVFGDIGKPLLDVARDADAVAQKAKVILDTDYSLTTDDPRGFK